MHLEAQVLILDVSVMSRGVRNFCSIALLQQISSVNDAPRAQGEFSAVAFW